MNRRDMSVGVAGMLATLAATSCTAPKESSALPAQADDRSAGSVGFPLSVGEVVLVAPTSTFSPLSRFRLQKNQQCTVTSSDPAVCKIVESVANEVFLTAVSPGHAMVQVDDRLNKWLIHVYIVTAC